MTKGKDTTSSKSTPKSARTAADKDVRHTDANPPVVDGRVLEPTDEQKRAELEGHSEFEKETGVKPEEIDTRKVVDNDPGDGKTFDERTSSDQPWRTYQEGRSKVIADDLQTRTGDSEKLTADDAKNNR